MRSGQENMSGCLKEAFKNSFRFQPGRNARDESDQKSEDFDDPRQACQAITKERAAERMAQTLTDLQCCPEGLPLSKKLISAPAAVSGLDRCCCEAAMRFIKNSIMRSLLACTCGREG